MPPLPVEKLHLSLETTEIVMQRRVRHTVHIQPANTVKEHHQKADSQDDSFHTAIAPSTFKSIGVFHSNILFFPSPTVLVIAQCFGLMPVIGITQPTPNKLKFQWRCLRSLYTVLYVLACIWVLLMAIKNTANKGFSSRNLGNKHFFFILNYISHNSNYCS
jgi:hypothetical protein